MIFCGHELQQFSAARPLEKITSSFPAPNFVRLCYRNSEYCKTKAPKQNRNNFNGKIFFLEEQAIDDLRWWRDTTDRIYNNTIASNS